MPVYSNRTRGPAGGDLSGSSYPNPVISKIQNTPISASTPTSGNLLSYNGSKWVAAAGIAGDITAVNAGTNLVGGGDAGSVTLNLTSSITSGLDNISGLTNVTTQTSSVGVLTASGPVYLGDIDKTVKIQTREFNLSTVSTGQALAWDGSKFIPTSTGSGGGPSGVAGGILTGSYPNPIGLKADSNDNILIYSYDTSSEDVYVYLPSRFGNNGCNLFLDTNYGITDDITDGNNGNISIRTGFDDPRADSSVGGKISIISSADEIELSASKDLNVFGKNIYLNANIEVSGGADGGNVFIKGGNSDLNEAGDVNIYGGDSKESGSTGRIFIKDFNDPLNITEGVSGGGINFETANGGSPSGSGGIFTIALGNGGNATDSTNAGAAGYFSLITGKGGAASGSNPATVGGSITITSGDGGDGKGSQNAANGGTLSIKAGNGGQTGSIGNGGTGGSINLQAGNGTGYSFGGNVGLLGGEAGSLGGTGGDASIRGGTANYLNSFAGNANVYGGSSFTNSAGGTANVYGGYSSEGQGGNVIVEGGNSGISLYGEILLGLDRTSQITFGKQEIDVITAGRNVETGSAHTPSAASTIPVRTPVILLRPSSDTTMTATPMIQTSNIKTGTRIILIGDNQYKTIFTPTSSSHKLKLSYSSLEVKKYYVLELIYNGEYWCQIGYSTNDYP